MALINTRNSKQTVSSLVVVVALTSFLFAIKTPLERRICRRTSQVYPLKHNRLALDFQSPIHSLTSGSMDVGGEKQW
jgi:hypothetical protein